MRPFGSIGRALGLIGLLALSVQSPAAAGTAATLADGALVHGPGPNDLMTEVGSHGRKGHYRGRPVYRGANGYRGPKGYRNHRGYRGYRNYRGYRGYRGGPSVGFGFYFGPRYVVPPPVVYAPRPPVYYAPRRYGNQCSYWHSRCTANWSRYNDIRGCLRYHGC